MTTVTVLIGIMLLFIFIGVPISLSLILSGVIVFLFTSIPLDVIPVRLFNGLIKYHLLAVPMFIVMGHILTESGLAHRLIALANSLVGWMRGGLAMVNVVTSMFLAEMSGAGTADAAIMSKIFVPSMQREGYGRGFAAAVTSASASLGIIIPPSIAMIILGLYTDVSVAALFIAGIVPGLLLTAFQMIVCYVAARTQNYPVGNPFSLREVGRNFLDCWFILLIPVAILGSIFSGFATVTEAAEIGLLLVIVAGLTYGRLTIPAIARLFCEGVRQSAVIALIVTGSTLIAWIFANERVAYQLAEFVGALALPTWVILLLMNVFFIVIGTFLHGTATIIIAAPLFLPVALNLGLDPIHYGMIIMICQAIGQQTPPVASVLLTVASVSEVPLEEIIPWLGVFLVAFVAVLALVTYVPAVSTFLPGLVDL